MRRIALIVALCFAALTGCATLAENESKWIFRPVREAWVGDPHVTDGMSDVWITFDSKVTQAPAKLHGLWFPAAKTDAPLLLLLHGARWDVRGSAHRMRRMQELGFAVLAIDYRGFGQSSDNTPTEAKAYEDARQAWEWLGQQHPNRPRYIFGHSLGGAIATQLASEVTDESGLIVECTFTTVADVVRTYPFGWLPVSPFITQKFESAQRIGKVGSPVLVVHGDADTVIQPQLGQQLFEQAREPKRMMMVAGGTHRTTNALGMAQYREALRSLFGLAPPAP